VICAAPDSSGAIVAAAVQPADLSTCAVVLVTGSELSALTGVAFPAPADASEVWAWGFSLVVVSYMFAWGVGTVVNFIKTHK
jgi:fructose-specific phosphotransferase system IIC component